MISAARSALETGEKKISRGAHRPAGPGWPSPTIPAHCQPDPMPSSYPPVTSPWQPDGMLLAALSAVALPMLLAPTV